MGIPLVIIGAGGMGREIHGIVHAINAQSPGTWDLLGFIDDGLPHAERLRRLDAPHLGGVSRLAQLPEGTHVSVGIGSGAPRRMLTEKALAAGLRPAMLIHPTATIGPSTRLGDGCVLSAGVRVTTNVTLGDYVILNLNTTVGHDSILDDYVTLHPSASVSGECRLERDVTLGTHSSVIQGVTIGEGTTVGAGAAVVRDLPAHTTAVGIPAKARNNGSTVSGD